MQRIANITKQPERVAPKRGGINSPFNDAVGRVCEFMNDRRFAYWCGRLRKIPAQEIDSMRSIAMRDGKKPAAYFEYLLKKRKSTVKKLSTQKMDSTPTLGI